jgi:hypothetical protein
MSKFIKVKVDIVGGAGGVFVDLDIGEDKVRHITSSSEYIVELKDRHYVAIVAGSGPSHGSLSITVLDGKKVLDSVKFTQPTFTGFLIFDVKSL